MARIRRWKEKLLLVWFTVFTSFVWARPKSRTLEDHSSPARTLFLSGSRGKRAWGVTLSTSRPYVRTLIASAMPVALPAAVGAFAASAGAMAGAAAAAAAAASSVCSSGGPGKACVTSQATPCSLTAATCCRPCATRDGVCVTCHTDVCTGGLVAGQTECRTCGAGTCPATCLP